MSLRHYGRPIAYWKTQLPVDYDTAVGAQNTWYTADADLSEGSPAKIKYIIIEQTTGGAADVELEITLNGTARTASFNGNDGTKYYIYLHENLSGGDWYLERTTNVVGFGSGLNTGTAVFAQFSSVGLVRIRQTSAAGGGSLEVNIVWDKLTVLGA